MKKMLRLRTDPETGEQTYSTVKKVLARRQTKQVLLPIVTDKERQRLLDTISPMMEANTQVDGVSTLEFTKVWNDLRIGMAKTRAQQTFYRGKRSLIAEENEKKNKNSKNNQQQEEEKEEDKQDKSSSQVVVEGVEGEQNSPLDPNAATTSNLNNATLTSTKEHKESEKKNLHL